MFKDKKIYDYLFKIESIIFNIPEYKKNESLDQYIKRIGIKKALRFLKYRIKKHIDITPALLTENLSRFKKKKDRNAMKKIFIIINNMQETELELYENVIIKKRSVYK